MSGKNCLRPAILYQANMETSSIWRFLPFYIDLSAHKSVSDMVFTKRQIHFRAMLPETWHMNSWIAVLNWMSVHNGFSRKICRIKI